MSFTRNFRRQGTALSDDSRYLHNRTNFRENGRKRGCNWIWSDILNPSHDFVRQIREKGGDYHYLEPSHAPSMKRRRFFDALPSNSADLVPYLSRAEAEASTSASCKRGADGEPVFLSKDDIERLSPSRKDGIDSQRETYLRYSYCAFIQNLGLRLQLPQTTIGTAMVLCHRFFVRRSHALHDRFLVASATLFLAAKSEETPRPLNDVLRASSEIVHKQDISLLSYMLPIDWFEQYRDRVLEAEKMVLTTLNFELNVQHPYSLLTSTLSKLGLSQSILVNLALKLVSEGLRSSLWLQFKPHHIAAGAAYLAAKFLNFDLTSSHNMWREFQTTPAILQDVTQQLMELF